MPETIYLADEIIFKPGDPSECAYLIRSGEVEILDGFPENPIRLAVLKDGAIFGEMGLVDERPRSLAARALAETRVAQVSREQFTEMIIHEPREAMGYLQMFFERLRNMNMKVAAGGVVPERTEKMPVRDGVVVITSESPAIKNIMGGEIKIEKFPFRVGRYTKNQYDPLSLNDLSISDSPPFNLSRNHFSIEKSSEGFFLHDRGSYLGTIVNGRVIGGHKKEAWVRLESGKNEIIAGSSDSPFKFSVEVS